MSPSAIDDQGQSTTVTVTVNQGTGVAAMGAVTLTAPAGSFDGAGTSVSVQLDGNSRASASFACAAASDTGCSGRLRLAADWNGNIGYASVDVGDVPPETDAGTDGGTDGEDEDEDEQEDPTLALGLTASKSNIYLALGDTAILTATATSTAGGNAPIAGEPVTFTTTAGYVGTDAASATNRTVTVETNAQGVATAVLVDDGAAGVAQVTAKARLAVTQASVTFVEVASITHTGTTCGGTNCTVMGIRGSGFNETANLTFNVKDAQGRAAVGVQVLFSIANAPAETTWSPSGSTDGAGNVTANVVSGPTTGVFALRAVAIEGRVATNSDSIGIRGAKPSNQGFALQGATRNIATFANTPLSAPKEFSVNCTVRVVDRLNNPVGTGTPVSLNIEAGAVPASTSTTPYSPTGNNANEGIGTFALSTIGGNYPPKDVEPLAADPAQLPRPREAEPFGTDYALIRNPRDGFVTIMASVRGEEYFSDTNNNGTWDPGEQFIDQGEPFVDENDNGVWDPGEHYVDQAPANGQWDGPNGVWDSDTTIWTETRVLFTGSPDPEWSHATPATGLFAPLCPGGLGKGQSTQIRASFLDLNLNRLQLQNATFTATRTAGPKGTIAVASATNLDGFGFTWNRLKVRPSDGAPCGPSDPICEWRIVFEDWGQTDLVATVTGAATTDTTPCATPTFRLRGGLYNVNVDFEFTGGIE